MGGGKEAAPLPPEGINNPYSRMESELASAAMQAAIGDGCKMLAEVIGSRWDMPVRDLKRDQLHWVFAAFLASWVCARAKQGKTYDLKVEEVERSIHVLPGDLIGSG